MRDQDKDRFVKKRAFYPNEKKDEKNAKILLQGSEVTVITPPTTTQHVLPRFPRRDA